jgi:acetyl-CoA acetyltransferase
MRFDKSFVPYGAYWSTPFCKWQGSLSHLNAIALAADTAKKALAARKIETSTVDAIALGMTVLQKHQLYGGPWFAAMIGAESQTGPMIAQACATGARTVASAAAEVDATGEHSVLAVTADRSNEAHVYYPEPAGSGRGTREDIAADSLGHIRGRRNSISDGRERRGRGGNHTERQDECTPVRVTSSTQQALAGGRRSRSASSASPFEVKDPSGRKTVATVANDEGIFATTKDGLAALKPVMPGGTVTFGSQTHPADGNCGMIVTSRDRAKAMSKDPSVEVQLVAYGQGRAKKGFMAMATVPAAKSALEAAGIGLKTSRPSRRITVRGQRCLPRKIAGLEDRRLQQLRLIARLRPPAGAHV